MTGIGADEMGDDLFDPQHAAGHEAGGNGLCIEMEIGNGSF